MRFSGVLGDGATPCARQAALLFALSGMSAVASMPSQPNQAQALAVIAVADLATAVAAWFLPWDRWGIRAAALLALPGFAVLGLSTWVFGGFAAGTGPFFVLIFAWLGLHQPISILVANLAPATAGYLAPLIAVRAPGQVLASAIVLVPVAFGIGWLIAAQANHLREERAQARRADRMRAALMATVAHDIRSPLTVVQGSLMLVTELTELPLRVVSRCWSRRSGRRCA